jgi:hypothetical protein
MSNAQTPEEPRDQAQDADDLVFGEPTDQDAKAWKADTYGKQLHGVLRKVDSFLSNYTGEQALRIIIEDKAGQRWSIIPPAQLRRLFTERWLANAVDINRPIAVVYDKEVELKNGRGKMKVFRVLPEPGEAVERARAANAVAAVVKAASRQPGDDDFTDDDPALSGKKPALDHMG